MACHNKHIYVIRIGKGGGHSWVYRSVVGFSRYFTILPSKDDCGKKGGASGKNPSRNGAKESRSKRREKKTDRGQFQSDDRQSVVVKLIVSLFVEMRRVPYVVFACNKRIHK